MSATACCNDLPLNPRQPTGLLHRLQALWLPFRKDLQQRRLTQALDGLSDQTLCDINAPDWLRSDMLHRAEMEQYDRLRTLSQFRGFM